jgi:hypothetical protein
MITVREYQQQDAAAAREIWNEVVREGVAFPQVEELTESCSSTLLLLLTFTPCTCMSAWASLNWVESLRVSS